MQFIQQFTGINAIIYYAPTIFKNIGMTGESVDLLATGVVGIIDFVFTIPAILFMDQWGRKKVLIVGGIGMSISQLLVATIYAVYNGSWERHPAAGWACAAFVWAYIANFAFSIGCVNWIIPSEIFPPGVRSQAVGLAIGTNWLSNVSTIYEIHDCNTKEYLVHCSIDLPKDACSHQIWHFLFLSWWDLPPSYCELSLDKKLTCICSILSLPHWLGIFLYPGDTGRWYRGDG